MPLELDADASSDGHGLSQRRLDSVAMMPEVRAELDEVAQAVREGGMQLSVLQVLASASLRKQLILGVTLQLMQQFAGGC